MAGIIQFRGYNEGEPDAIYEHELTLEGASVRVTRWDTDAVTLAVEQGRADGDACLAVELTRNQASALIKMLIEAAS